MKSGFLGECRLSDGVLEIALCETEGIVSGRQSWVKMQKIGLTPLPPKHLLMLKGCPVIPQGKFDVTDMYRRQ